MIYFDSKVRYQTFPVGPYHRFGSIVERSEQSKKTSAPTEYAGEVGTPGGTVGEG